MWPPVWSSQRWSRWPPALVDPLLALLVALLIPAARHLDQAKRIPGRDVLLLGAQVLPRLAS